MAQPVTPVPIEHHPMIHEVAASRSAAPRPLTLFELVEAVSEVTDDEHEIIATVDWMLESGRVKLIHATSSAERWERIFPQAFAPAEYAGSPVRRLA